MGIIDFKQVKWDKKVIIYNTIVILVAIISGIVLYITNNTTKNFYNFAKNYIYLVFNFENASLFFGHFFSDLFYFSIIFLLCYFTRCKFLASIFLFVKTFFTAYYIVLLFALFAIEGIIAAIIVFIPCYALWVFKFLFIRLNYNSVCKPWVYIMPAFFSLVDGVVLLLFVNLIFRFIVVIV